MASKKAVVGRILPLLSPPANVGGPVAALWKPLRVDDNDFPFMGIVVSIMVAVTGGTLPSRDDRD